jgi:predicted alpha/beta-fold hydrolase
MSNGAFSPEREFRPFPLLRNPHVQTVLGHFLPGPSCPLPDRQRILWLPDGDGLVLHDNVPPQWRPGGPIAILVHGLSGSHASAHVCRVAGPLLLRGVRTVRLDLRGAGKGLPLARRVYHAGRSEDVRAAVEEVHRWSPASPLLLIGVSLGGALVLKTAGEAADAPIPGLERVAALAPPIDLERCAALIAEPRNRIYDDAFVRDLVFEARKRHRYFPDLPPPRFPRQMTIRRFDDLYTAPSCGFADARDYYRRASAAPLIPRIALPTLILTARDDPFIAVEPFEELRLPAQVELRILSHGGHIGFLGWDGAGGIRWAERRLVDWVTRVEDRGGNTLSV